MIEPHRSEAIMDSSAIYDFQNESGDKRSKQLFWLFPLGLFLFDVLTIEGSFLLTGWFSPEAIKNTIAWDSFCWPMIFGLLVFFFFSSNGLYSYHLIFSRKKHAAGIFLAMGWAILTVSLIKVYFMAAKGGLAYPNIPFALLYCAIAGIAWFVEGRSQRYLHATLMALGISFFAISILHPIYEKKGPAFSENLWLVPVGLIVSSILLSAGRFFLIEIVYNRWLYRYFRRQVAIIGANGDAKRITAHIIDNNSPVWVTGTIGSSHHLNDAHPKERLGSIRELPDLFEKHNLSDMIVTDQTIHKRILIDLLEFALPRGMTLWFSPKVLPIIDQKLRIHNFCGIPMIRIYRHKRYLLYNRMKRLWDTMMTLPLLILLAPIFTITALAVKFTSKGPVFHRANAIGRGGDQFKMFKFRSMTVNNDNDIHKKYITQLIHGEIGNDGSENQTPLKITNDPRITRVGKFIRKYSLDELPQLFNVIFGQMSLIGPRPCLDYEYQIYEEWYKKRTAIRPGITGIWQVTGRSEVSFEEMILLDLYYVYNRNIWMDINILIETIFVVLKKKGAY